MAKIWRNRLIAGTQFFENCPVKYKATVLALLREDVSAGVITAERLREDVSAGVITAERFREITGQDY